MPSSENNNKFINIYAGCLDCSGTVDVIPAWGGEEIAALNIEADCMQQIVYSVPQDILDNLFEIYIAVNDSNAADISDGNVSTVSDLKFAYDPNNLLALLNELNCVAYTTGVNSVGSVANGGDSTNKGTDNDGTTGNNICDVFSRVRGDISYARCDPFGAKDSNGADIADGFNTDKNTSNNTYVVNSAHPILAATTADNSSNRVMAVSDSTSSTGHDNGLFINSFSNDDKSAETDLSASDISSTLVAQSILIRRSNEANCDDFTYDNAPSDQENADGELIKLWGGESTYMTGTNSQELAPGLTIGTAQSIPRQDWVGSSINGGTNMARQVVFDLTAQGTPAALGIIDNESDVIHQANYAGDKAIYDSLVSSSLIGSLQTGCEAAGSGGLTATAALRDSDASGVDLSYAFGDTEYLETSDVNVDGSNNTLRPQNIPRMWYREMLANINEVDGTSSTDGDPNRRHYEEFRTRLNEIVDSAGQYEVSLNTVSTSSGDYYGPVKLPVFDGDQISFALRMNQTGNDHTVLDDSYDKAYRGYVIRLIASASCNLGNRSVKNVKSA
jgi:hypothetical protein